MNRLKRGYAVRSIDAIAHSDQLPLRQAHAPERYRPHRTGRTPPPSQPWAILESAGTSFLIYPWRVLGLPWLHPCRAPLNTGPTSTSPNSDRTGESAAIPVGPGAERGQAAQFGRRSPFARSVVGRGKWFWPTLREAE